MWIFMVMLWCKCVEEDVSNILLLCQNRNNTIEFRNLNLYLLKSSLPAHRWNTSCTALSKSQTCTMEYCMCLKNRTVISLVKLIIQQVRQGRQHKEMQQRACSLVGAGAGLGWLVLVFVRGKHCWLAGLGWLKPTSEHAENLQQHRAEAE